MGWTLTPRHRFDLLQKRPKRCSCWTRTMGREYPEQSPVLPLLPRVSSSFFCYLCSPTSHTRPPKTPPTDDAESLRISHLTAAARLAPAAQLNRPLLGSVRIGDWAYFHHHCRESRHSFATSVVRPGGLDLGRRSRSRRRHLAEGTGTGTTSWPFAGWGGTGWTLRRREQAVLVAFASAEVGWVVGDTETRLYRRT